MIYDHNLYNERKNSLLRNGKRFYYSYDDLKAEQDVFKTIWVLWTHEWPTAILSLPSLRLRVCYFSYEMGIALPKI